MLKNDTAAHSAFLANNGWLHHTPRDFAESFLAHCHWRRIAAGTGIQHAGEGNASLTGIASGSTTLTTSLSTPDSPIIYIMHPGDWFGYGPLFLARNRPLSVVARTDVTIASMSQPEVEAFLANRPEWWRHVGTLGVIYGNVAISMAADMMIRDSSRRCAAALLQLSECRHRDPPGGEALEALMSQEELAAIANLSRTSISTILRDLEAGGLIKLGYRSVIILNAGRLRAMVDDV